MAQTVYSLSQIASAERLLADSHAWTRGTRKADRVAFVLFPSSNGRDAYYTSLLGGGVCTCRGWLYRGKCSHALACNLDTEQAREQAVKRQGYQGLFPLNEDSF